MRDVLNVWLGLDKRYSWLQSKESNDTIEAFNKSFIEDENDEEEGIVQENQQSQSSNYIYEPLDNLFIDLNSVCDETRFAIFDQRPLIESTEDLPKETTKERKRKAKDLYLLNSNIYRCLLSQYYATKTSYCNRHL